VWLEEISLSVPEVKNWIFLAVVPKNKPLVPSTWRDRDGAVVPIPSLD